MSEWQEKFLEKLRAGWAKEGEITNMAFLHMKDGSQVEFHLVAPNEEVYKMEFEALKTKVQQGRLNIEETALVLNSLDDHDNHSLIVCFESKKESSMLKLKVSGKTLVDDKKESHVHFPLGLFAQEVDFGGMYR